MAKPSPQKVLLWGLVILTVVVVGAATAALARDLWSGTFPVLDTFLKPQGAAREAIILLLLCAGIATVVLIALRATRGTLEFRALGVSFTGPSGPVLLWIASFLSLAAATTTFISLPAKTPPDPTPSASTGQHFTAESEAAQAIISGNITDVYINVGIKHGFFEDWGRPPSFSTLEVRQSELFFKSPDRRTVSISVDTALMPNADGRLSSLLFQAQLSGPQAKAVSAFYTSYGQLRNALAKLSSTSGEATRTAFIEASSIARVTTQRGQIALCLLDAPLPSISAPPHLSHLFPTTCPPGSG